MTKDGQFVGSPDWIAAGKCKRPRFSQGNVKRNGRCQSGSGRCCHQTPIRWTDTDSQRQSVQWVGRRCRAAGYEMAAQQRGPTVWEMCRLLSGNGMTPIPSGNRCQAQYARSKKRWNRGERSRGFRSTAAGTAALRFNIRSLAIHPQVAPRVKSCNLISLPNHKIRLKIWASYENIS